MHDERRDETKDCQAALRELYVFLDGEMTAERRTLVHHHLDSCGDCLEAYEFETELRVRIAACCHADEVPESLRARLRGMAGG